MLSWTALLFLAAAVSASAQGGPVKILISSRIDPVSAGQEEAAVAAIFENRVQALLMYPCTDPLTRGDVAALLGYDRVRQLLDANHESELTNIAGALGAAHYASLTVTPMDGGRYSLSGAMTSADKVQTVVRASTTTTTGAATQGVDLVARQLVGNLASLKRFSRENCAPTNPWTGTVTLRMVDARQATSESKPSNDEGTITSTSQAQSVYEATVRVGWTGAPRVQVRATGTRREEEVGKIMRDRGRSGGGGRNTPVLKSAGYQNVDILESRATGDADTVGSFSVSLAKGKLALHISVSGIEETTSVKSQKRFDGGCGEPTSSDQTVEIPWTTWSVVLSRDFEAEAGGDPNEQSGTLTTDRGETVTWKLTRTPMRK
jgi:hypothetical protein